MNIPAWFTKLFGSLGRFLSLLFQGALKKELDVVLPIAAAAVRSIAADPSVVQPGAKRDAAVALILAELAAAQVSVGLSVINLAVELAVVEYKSSISTVDAPVKPGA